jgi:uncharacterized protein involved in exopolysaccharide biosynthesis
MADIGARTARELGRVVFSRLGTVLAIVVVITGGTLAACLLAPKHYQSQVTFLVKEPRPQNPAAQEVSSDRSLQVFIKTQYELVKSQTVLARTVAMLMAPDSPAAKQWREARQAWERETTKERWKAFTDALTALDKEVLEREKDAFFRDAVRRFARKVKIETPGGEQVALSEVITVQVVQPEPVDNAYRATDLLAKTYIDRYREKQAERGLTTSDFMKVRLEDLKNNRLKPSETAVRDFVEKELDSPSDLVILEQLMKSGGEAGRQITVRRFQEEMITNDSLLAEARQLRKQVLEQLPQAIWDGPRAGADGELVVPTTAKLDKMTDEDPILTDTITIIPEETLKNNVVVHQLKAKEVDLLIDLNRLKVEYKPEYRLVQDKLTEIARTRRQILKELIGEASALDIKYSTLTARQKEIGSKLEGETKRLNKITSQLVRYNELQNEATLAREEYRKASTDLASAMAYQQQQADAITISVLDPPKLPDAMLPVYPQPVLYTILAGLVGLLLATAYAFTADYFDHTLSSIEATERYLGVPVVGSVGHHRQGLVS